MINLTKYLFLAIYMLTVLFVTAQDADMLKQFLTVEDGLSLNEVTSIVQDKDGFMWIGTRGGLNRYDGYEFKVFNQVPDVENSLVNPSIETLFIDSKENIWIGTKSGGVSKYNPVTGKFKNIINNYQQTNAIISSNRVLSFYEDKQGQIWMGTWGDGIFVYNEAENSAKQYLNGSRINTIIGAGENRIWAGASVQNGLYEYIAETDSFVKRMDKRCKEIVYDEPRNVLWVVGGDNIGAALDNKGLSRFDLRNNTWINYNIEDSELNSSKLPHAIYSLHLDETEKIWIGTWGTGLYTFDPELESFERKFIYPEGGQNTTKDYDAVLDIFQDNNNNIWLGTNGGGICVLTPQLGFHSVGYNAKPGKGLNNSRLRSLMEDSDGNFWIGTVGSGLLWSTDMLSFYPVDFPLLLDKSRFFVMKYMLEDSSGNIWVGTNLGTYIVEFVNGFPLMVKASKKYNSQTFNRTAVSFLDAEGMLLLGTLQQGLFFYDKSNYQLLKKLKKGNNQLSTMKSDRISCLFQDSKNRIWVGTYNGLHIYNKQDTTIHIVEKYFNIDGKFTGNIITCIEEDLKGNLWVGSPNGLNKLSQTGENEFKNTYYTEKDGLANSFIKSIARDLRGNVWCSTNTGISKFSAKKEQFINFDESDGVQTRTYTETSVFRNSRGDIFFGGTQGLTYFKPEEIIVHRESAKPVFTGLSILNEPITIGEKYDSRIILEKSISRTNEIELSYRQDKIEIQFSSLDFVSNGKNQYEFLLKNQDKEWTNIGSRRFAIFHNLKPGEYILLVKSANRHNVWSDESAELKIIISPPFWRTWYALLMYIFIALGIITIIRWNAVKQVRLTSSLEMEKLQREQDLKMNEMKFRFFTNISHEFRTPLTLILAPLKEIQKKKEAYNLDDELSTKLSLIQNNSLRLMRMVNQLLDFRKVESGNMNLAACKTNLSDFVSEVCYPFYELAQINNIKFTSKSSLKTKEIWFDRDKLEIVLNNLISNAFKYLKSNGEIEVSVYEEEEEVLLSVSDNGPGIPSHELNHIFERFYQIEKKDTLGGSGIGLALTKRFVELHHGTISVTSEQGVNTEFTVSLPKGKTHLKPEETIRVENVKAKLVNKEPVFSNVLASKSKVKVQTDVCILVVDDSEEIRNYLIELLEPLYCIDFATNGVEGIAKVKQKQPDLIISDVMMPEMDGFEFCKKIRSKENTATIPFIFLTAKTDEQFRLLGTQAGANDYISKPFDLVLLLEKVKNILDRQKKLQKQYSKSVRLEPSDIEITSTEEAFIRKVIEVIEKNLNNDQFSSEVLASELNRSYSSLYRKLKKLTGLSAAEFIRSIRIKRAGQLLVDKEKTISEIAYEVGFNDVKHFRTVFQKHFLCSPSKYREKLAQEMK